MNFVTNIRKRREGGIVFTHKHIALNIDLCEKKNINLYSHEPKNDIKDSNLH